MVGNNRSSELNSEGIFRQFMKLLQGLLGWAGTVAARLLVEFGMEPRAAIRRVRAARKGAIQTWEQEEYVLGCGRNSVSHLSK